MNETEFCEIPHEFHTFNEFFICYTYFVSKQKLKSSLELFLIILVIGFNLILTLFIIFQNNFNIPLFGQIIISHCIVEGFTGIFDIPFYHINDLFNYWPLSKKLSYFWNIFDNNINFITNFHMFYISWILIRSIKKPKGFKNEFLIKKRISIIITFWIIGLFVWIPVVLIYGTRDFTLKINFNPRYVSCIINFFTWFLFLIFIFMHSVYLIYLIYKLNAKRKMVFKELAAQLPQSKSTDNKLSALSLLCSTFFYLFIDFIHRWNIFINQNKFYKVQIRFLFIIISFWVQWIIPCILNIISSSFINFPYEISNSVYWLTYTACMTDPIMMFIFNNIIYLKRSSRKVNPL